MLALIRALGPVAALLIGMVGGGGIITAVGVAYNTYIDNPHVIALASQKERDACAIRTMDAANRAETAERERQRRVNSDVLTIFRRAAELEEEMRRIAEDELDKEIIRHEAELSDARRICTITDGDFEWLRK